jgi:hypothetical protein
MTIMRWMGRLAFVLSAGMLSSVSLGCSSDKTEPARPAADAASETAADTAGATTFKAKIKVPTSLSGTPRQIIVAAFDNLPLAGPPAVLPAFLQKDVPELKAGEEIEIDTPTTADGDYYVVAILYMQGGGTLGPPKPGVDYQAATAQRVTFTPGETLDIGTLELALAPGGGDAGAETEPDSATTDAADDGG